MDQVKMAAFAPDRQWAAGTTAPVGISFNARTNLAKLVTGEGAIKIATLGRPDLFSRFQQPVHKLQECIKRPGEDKLTIPACYEQFSEAFQKIAAYEEKHSPLYLYKRAFLTLRQSRLQPGQVQVSLPWHIDRQHVLYAPDETPLVDHIYVVSDFCPTLLQAQPLTNAFNELSRAGMRRGKDGLSIQAPSHAIMLMNNYCYHASPPVDQSGIRTFLRIIYESPSAAEIRALPLAVTGALNLSCKGYAR